jgi:hypothetical protein
MAGGVVLLALLVAIATAASAPAADRRPLERSPLVRVLAESPVTITGMRFQPSERVTVRVLVFGDKQLGKVVTAGQNGVFATSFPGLAIPECRGYVVTAVGSKGSRAHKRQFVISACGSAPQPSVDLQP